MQPSSAELERGLSEVFFCKSLDVTMWDHYPFTPPFLQLACVRACRRLSLYGRVEGDGEHEPLEFASWLCNDFGQNGRKELELDSPLPRGGVQALVDCLIQVRLKVPKREIGLLTIAFLKKRVAFLISGIPRCHEGSVVLCEDSFAPRQLPQSVRER